MPRTICGARSFGESTCRALLGRTGTQGIVVRSAVGPLRYAGGMRKRLVPSKEVAEALGVHERTVRRWCQRHEVDAVLTPGGKLWRVWVDADGVPLRA